MAVEGNRPRVVLVVEDSETCAAMAEMALLPLLGVTVVLARSACDALGILHGGSPVEAIVTDLNMPSMDGFDLIRAIRADRRLAEMPILVVSGDTDPSTPARVVQLGANAFFSKPYSPTLLRRKLEQLLNATSQ
jgi:two-component system, chemotaxis family, chemotaxis protein CheY